MAAASDRPPLIGITTSEVRRPEITHPLPESEPPQPELALGMPYVRALARSGAVPVVLPPLAIELVPAGLPILGICRGCQALNVARGGSLHQHLPAVADGSVDHRQAAAGWKVTHQVTVEPRSRLAQALGAEALAVNSFHHQAVQRLGDGLRAVAWAADGTVEGIEDDARFVLGVQWHAETLEEVERPQARLFTALVDAALESAVALR
jgi:putative glutamine amidotransferase